MSLARLRNDLYGEDHLVAPSVAAGATAQVGTGGTATFTGGDTHGQIVLTTGTSPSAAGTVATITFANPYSVAPVVVVSPNDAVTEALGVYASATATAATIGVHTEVAGSTTYKINFLAIGGA
jgi:hypothetical protein